MLLREIECHYDYYCLVVGFECASASSFCSRVSCLRELEMLRLDHRANLAFLNPTLTVSLSYECVV